MKVEVQFTADCPNARPVLQRLSELARRRTDLELVVTLVQPDRPAPSGFAGSPTVLVDDVNPFPGEPTGHAACALHPPTADQVEAILESAGARVVVESPVEWTWTDGPRPYAVPSRLWRLAPEDALRLFEPGLTLWWSGPSRTYDLADREDRCRLYEIVLREGGSTDIEDVVDGLLLCEAWRDLTLPRPLAAAWEPMVSGAHGAR